MKAFVLSIFLLLLPLDHAEASTPDDARARLLTALQGPWTRVLQKCPSEVSSPELLRLPLTGGEFLTVSRRMDFHVDGDRFTATTRPSLRCGTEHESDDSAYTYCGGTAVNQGEISDITENSFRMVASVASYENTWGTVFREWYYRWHGNVLELWTGPQYVCPDGMVHMFLIRPPLS